jgi:hypothetical protein
MHFCMTGQYTPKALNSIMENPKTNRYEAAKKLIEAADCGFRRSPPGCTDLISPRIPR